MSCKRCKGRKLVPLTRTKAQTEAMRKDVEEHMAAAAKRAAEQPPPKPGDVYDADFG